MSVAFRRLEALVPLKVDMKFPYSMLISGIGIIFAFLGWVLCIILHRRSRESHAQNMDQGPVISNTKSTYVKPQNVQQRINFCKTTK